MKLVVLDSHTLNPGDLSWVELETLASCTFHERSAPDEIVERARHADLILSNKALVTRAHLEQLPTVRYIGVLATGYNNIDTIAARERGIPVCNVPAYGTDSVAQMTFALLLELTNRVGHHAQTVRELRWNRCPDFCYTDFPLIELKGLTLGIVGYGRIGQAVAALGRAFGMRVLATSRTQPADGKGADDVEFVSLETLLRCSDVVSLHCPLTDQTRSVINAERLGWMKPGALLVNTSRGPLIDEPALAEALKVGRIAGAALDVLSVEPPREMNPLFELKNCLITPHISWATKAARERLLNTAVANVRAYLQGTPQNVVNGL